MSLAPAQLLQGDSCRRRMWASGGRADSANAQMWVQMWAGLARPMSVPVQMLWGEPYLGGAVAGVSRFGPGADVGGVRPIWEGGGEPGSVGDLGIGGSPGDTSGKAPCSGNALVMELTPIVGTTLCKPKQPARYSVSVQMWLRWAQSRCRCEPG